MLKIIFLFLLKKDFYLFHIVLYQNKIFVNFKKVFYLFNFILKIIIICVINIIRKTIERY